MSKLRTPTGLRIGGTWLQPGDVVPEGVSGFDYAKAARKGLIEHEDGEAITNPEGPAAQATAEDAARVSDLEQANHDLKRDLDELTEGFKRVQAARDELDQELRLVRTELDAQAVQHKDALTGVNAAREALQVELDQTRAALEELQSAPAPAGLPADARDRLIALNGVNEKRADEILAALTRVD